MVFKQTNEQTLGEVIEQLMESYRIKNRFYEQKLIAKYPEIVGPMISRYTENLQIRNRVLFLKIASPLVRNELSYARSSLTESLNKAVGKDVIDKIVLK
ncbi:MAG: DUF721 domain-containing protein [Bacteroidota bacterium]